MLSTMMHLPLGVKTITTFGARHFGSSRIGDYDGERIHWTLLSLQSGEVIPAAQRHREFDGRQSTQSLAAEYWSRKEISLLDIAKSLGIALAVEGGGGKTNGSSVLSNKLTKKVFKSSNSLLPESFLKNNMDSR